MMGDLGLGLRYASQAQRDLLGLTPPAGRDATVGADGSDGVTFLWEALSVAGGAIGAYHGYKRDDSIGWAIGWGVLGVLFPVIVIPVALAQGLGKRK